MAAQTNGTNGAPVKVRCRPIILLGAPGAGKGTQAKVVARRLDVPHLSTGDMFREQMARGSELGLRAKAIVEAGNLVPDDLVIAMVAERLARPDCARGYVLDGFPRTVAQAMELDKMLGQSGPVVINLRVEYNGLIQRLTGRRSCPECGTIYNVHLQPPAREGLCDADGTALVQRADDNEDVIRERLAAYENLTRPLVDYYRKRRGFYEVDANQPPEQISEALLEILRSANDPERRAEA